MPKKILIVDDEQDLAASLAASFIASLIEWLENHAGRVRPA